LRTITFDAGKRAVKLRKHGIDLADCGSLFDAPMETIEESREAYGEQRLGSLGWLANRVVVRAVVDRPRGRLASDVLPVG
jgi:uncharacterized DUF497 family protein